MIKLNLIGIVFILGLFAVFQFDGIAPMPPGTKNGVELALIVLLVDRLFAFILKLRADKSLNVLQEISVTMTKLTTFMQSKEEERIHMIDSVNTRLGGIGRDVAILLDRKNQDEIET